MRPRLTIVLIISASPLLQGETTTFTQNATVNMGDAYEIVVVQDTPPDRTTLEMLGGSIGWLQAHDQSTANVRGGWMFAGHAYGTSTINIHQMDEMADLGSFDDAVVNLYWGNTLDLRAGGSSTANVYGGFVSHIVDVGAQGTVSILGGQIGDPDWPGNCVAARDAGTINIYGGSFYGYLAASGSSLVNIYGYGFGYDPLGGIVGQGLITGFWIDATPFSISLRSGSSDTYSHIRFLPEPTTALLAAVALALALPRRRSRLFFDSIESSRR